MSQYYQYLSQYLNNCAVGIGTTTPNGRLEISKGTAPNTTIDKTQTLSVIGDAISSSSTTAVQEILRLHQPNTTSFSKGSSFGIGLSFWEDPGNNYPRTRVDFRTTGRTNDSSVTANTIMSLRDDGYVGIGTTDPQGLLDVNQKLTVLSNGTVGIGTTAPNGLLDVNGGGLVYAGGNVGIGSAAPKSTLDVVGSVATAYSAKTANYTVTAADSVISTSASAGAFTVTLSNASSITGRQYTIIKNDSATNVVTLASAGGTIGFLSAQYLTFPGAFLTVVSNGTNWMIVGGNIVATDPKNELGGRLTLTSGTPVTSSDVTGATTIYYTAYNGNRVAIHDGQMYWNTFSLPKDTTSANCSVGAPCYQISLALGTLTGSLPYDVFVYPSAGVPTLELVAWNSATARMINLIAQDGVWVKSGNTTRRYLGTIYTTSTTTTEDSAANRFVWNVNNRVPRRLFKGDTGSWTYTSTTWRQANANSANKLQLVTGLSIDRISIVVNAFGQGNVVGQGAMVGIGKNGITTNNADTWSMAYTNTAGNGGSISATLTEVPAIGYNYYSWMEAIYANGSQGTFYGTTAGGNGGIMGDAMQ